MVNPGQDGSSSASDLLAAFTNGDGTGQSDQMDSEISIVLTGRLQYGEICGDGLGKVKDAFVGDQQVRLWRASRDEALVLQVGPTPLLPSLERRPPILPQR